MPCSSFPFAAMHTVAMWNVHTCDQSGRCSTCWNTNLLLVVFPMRSPPSKWYMLVYALFHECTHDMHLRNMALNAFMSMFYLFLNLNVIPQSFFLRLESCLPANILGHTFPSVANIKMVSESYTWFARSRSPMRPVLWSFMKPTFGRES